MLIVKWNVKLSHWILSTWNRNGTFIRLKFGIWTKVWACIRKQERLYPVLQCILVSDDHMNMQILVSHHLFDNDHRQRTIYRGMMKTDHLRWLGSQVVDNLHPPVPLLCFRPLPLPGWAGSSCLRASCSGRKSSWHGLRFEAGSGFWEGSLHRFFDPRWNCFEPATHFRLSSASQRTLNPRGSDSPPELGLFDFLWIGCFYGWIGSFFIFF